jgi:hypothetical protein
VAWYLPPDYMRWLSFTLPHRSLLKVLRLEGWFNRTKTVFLPQSWITWTEKNALVELVPSNFAAVDWAFYGAGFYAFFASHTSVPQFWQYYVVAGLRELDGDLMQFIAKRAAMHILTIAGQARYPAGIAGYSVSRDGVSESRSLQPGIYTQTIQRYAADTQAETPQGDLGIIRRRDRYRGILMVTL